MRTLSTFLLGHRKPSWLLFQLSKVQYANLVVNPTPPKSLRYPLSMRATTADDFFEFRILERGGKIIAQVYRRSAHSFDTTGKADRNPDWAFASIDEAKAWAQRHCAEVLKVPGQLHWT